MRLSFAVLFARSEAVRELTGSPSPSYQATNAVTAPLPVSTAAPPAEDDFGPRRFVDIVGALILMVLLSPVMLAVAAVIRCTSPGPVLYQQTRVGMNRRHGVDRRSPVARPVPVDRRRVDRRTIASAGKQFRIVKFRTMVENAEAVSGPCWAAKSDARVTGVGAFLRRYRLDELPQLINVLQGDMTFIGPRPERPFFVERFRRRIPSYADRLASRPGITGLAQVEHKYDESEEDVRRKLEYDLRYLRDRGLRNDLRILWKTVVVVLTGAGAH
jgi:lipopolysaccharide/colanic/teichoic acid biosynthesis glycosyltransferase